MEIYRSLGLHSQIRALGVPEEYSLDEIITTGLTDGVDGVGGGKVVSRWKRVSPRELREEGRRVNDGRGAREGYLRCSQIPVERWLKGLVLGETGVRSYFGWKFVGLKEEEDGVVSEVVHTESGERMRVRSRYVVGCDGAGSLVRKLAGIRSERKNL